MSPFRAIAVVSLVVAGFAAAGCGGTPGSDNEEGSKDSPVAEQGSELAGGKKVTLTIVDTDNDPGAAKAIDAVIAEFEAKNPNVTVERDGQNFDELMSKVGQLATSDDAPCIVHGSQGATDMALVKAGAIRSLEPYAEAYKWEDSFSAGQLATVRVAEDGSSYGDGTLYGIAPKAEIVGVFWNKKLGAQIGMKASPETFAEFEESLAKAKGKGLTAIGLGLSDYNMLPGLLFDHYVEPDQVRGWVFGEADATLDTPEGLQALQTIEDWAKKGYFYRDAVGVKDDDATARFAKGEALYYFSGPWRNASLADELGKDVGFFPIPAEDGGGARTTGAISTPSHITSKCDIPDVAGAYLGFLTSPEAAQILLENGDVPAVATDTSSVAASSQLDILTALEEVAGADGLNPYKDWAAPGMSDAIIATTQGLVSGQVTPEDGIKTIQEARDAG